MTQAGDRLLHYDDVEWDEFDPAAYWQHNYSSLRDDDRAIIAVVGAFFDKHFLAADPREERIGIDVGSGPNLYPALGMLPWCSKVMLTDWSKPNVEWLEVNTNSVMMGASSDDTWEWMPFWRAYGRDDSLDVRALLADRSEVAQQNVFDLPVARYDVGTMFFVAESITEDPAQFRQGIDRFLDALRVGAPFAIAFMEHRVNGYHVAGRAFPSTDIDGRDVQHYLSATTQLALVEHIDVGPSPLDDPYTGMVVACGRTRGVMGA